MCLAHLKRENLLLISVDGLRPVVYETLQLNTEPTILDLQGTVNFFLGSFTK